MPARKVPYDPNATEKPCSKCGAVKPLEDFPRDKQNRDGRRSDCLVCNLAKQHRYRSEHLDERRAAVRRHYWENRDRLLVQQRERYQRDREKRLAYEQSRAERRRHEHQQKMQSPEYRERRRQQAARWRNQNPGRAKAWYHAKMDDPAFRAKRRESSRAWKSRNPDRVRDRARQWRQAHPERVRAMTAKRRAVIRKAPTAQLIDRFAIAERDGWRCHICGKSIPKDSRAPDPKSLTLDHLVPISQGGPHTKDNVAAAHLRCNIRRGAGRLPAQLRLV